MGPYGETTRILAPIVNTGFTYCPVAVATAPGQLDAKMLREVYNYPILNRHTAIYGLIGNPVAHSIGHVFHNQNFLQHDVNAVYVKWCLSPEELDQAIPLLQALDVKGLSVTTPLKEAVVPYASLKDKVVTLLGASNTLVCSGDIWHAYATDGDGTVAALGTSLHDKTVVILGAGGAARE